MKHSSIKSQWTMNDLINKRSKVTDQLQMSMGPWCFLLVCGSIWSIWEISFSAQNVLKITWHSESCCPKPFPGTEIQIQQVESHGTINNFKIVYLHLQICFLILTYKISETFNTMYCELFHDVTTEHAYHLTIALL